MVSDVACCGLAAQDPTQAVLPALAVPDTAKGAAVSAVAVATTVSRRRQETV